MPPASTKSTRDVSAESEGTAEEPRVERVRRRIGERFYDRIDIRRTLAALILRRVRRRDPK